MRRQAQQTILFLIVLVTSFIGGILGTERSGERAEGPPSDWFYRQRAYPFGTINQELRKVSLAQARVQQSVERPAAAGPVWQQRGPSNVGGRLTALGISRLNPNLLYAGAADGGVLKSTDAGVHWTPLFDDQSSLSIGALAVDPANDSIVYVGTGEANSSGDSYDGFGLLKTTDGGVRWDTLGLEQTRHIGEIVIDPRNTATVYVAAMGTLFSPNPDRGVYKSTDAGSTWTKVLFVNDSTGVIDITIDPQHPDTLMAAAWQRMRGPQGRLYVGGTGTGIYRTTDGGVHWTILAGGLPTPAANVGRPGVAFSPSNPAMAYVCFADDPGNFRGVYRSTDGGGSWTRTNDGALASLYNGYGWYFGKIYVSPADPLRVFVLGLDIGKTTDGGTIWILDGGPPHVDHHAMAFHPTNPSVIYTGNDGGRAKTTDGGASWFTEPDQDLFITQFYAGCIDQLHPALSMGGTQDNGTPRTATGSASDWHDINGGDGFYCAIDYTNANYQYAEYQYGGLTRTVDNWSTGASYAGNGINPADRINWSAPLIMNPNNPSVLYAGTDRVYKTTDRADDWTAISGDLSNGPVPGFGAYATVTTIDVAAADSNTIIAGTDDANVWVTTTAGGTWVPVHAGLPNRWITRVRFDPKDRMTAYVTLSGYRSDSKLPHIFRTADLGSHWRDISGNLPEAPINVVCVDPDHTERLYVGTDVGTWFSIDTGATWSPMGSGLPNVVIDDMVLHEPTRIARAFTHGRSVWEINLDELVTSVSAAGPDRPSTFTLEQNYPNPFNPSTAIEFFLSHQERIRLTICDLTGRVVRTLTDGILSGGRYRVLWDGRNQDGAPVASGIYLCSLTSTSSSQSRKMLLIR